MNKNAERVGVYGASGSGKSTRVKALIAGERRLVVFDPLEEYEGTRCHSLSDVLRALKRGWQRGFRVVYVPPAGNEPEALHRLSRLLAGAQRPYLEKRDSRQLTLVVEEMNLSFPVTALPAAMNGFAELCSRGRHYGIGIVGVTQRLAEVNTRFRGNTTAAYFFRLADHADLSAAARMLGPAHASRLREFPPHRYLCASFGQVTEGANQVPSPRRAARS